ncbi:MAG: lactate utilization protein [Eubacteriales bacterium]
MDRIKNTIANLERNGFTVRYFEKAEDAVTSLISEIDKSETVGFGGSVTVDGLQIYEKLQEKGSPVFWHWKTAPDQNKALIMAQAATANVYLSSANAITEDGRLLNIDGHGNRLSSMLYGHKRLYVVAGVNKIAASLDEAFIRVKNIAAPMNAKRLDLDTPCRHLGKCMNCDSPQRICKATLIFDRQPKGVKVIIYLINENLGY